MADDIADTEGLQLFPLPVNWADDPQNQIYSPRILVQYPGTVMGLYPLSSNAPFSVRAGFLTANRQEQYDLIDFFNRMRGKHGRFWLKHPKTAFTLKQDAIAGAAFLSVENNDALDQYQGYERVYIERIDGSVIIRKIGIQIIANQHTLAFTTPLIAGLSTNECRIIGRLLLVRFDKDELVMKLDSETVSEPVLTFKELINEYSEIV